MTPDTTVRLHHRIWYVTFMERHETPAQRRQRQLAQGPPRDEASPCRRCAGLATTDLCVFCAIDATTGMAVVAL